MGSKSNHVDNKRQRGDTLVEVAIAMAVLGLMLASTMAIINRSLLGVMNAIESTATRGAVNSQVELLRYVFDTQNGVNKDVAKTIISKTTSDSGVANHTCSSGSGGFYLAKTSDSNAPVSFRGYSDRAVIAEDVFASPEAGNGIWIEGVKHDARGGVPGYIDFYVRACWSPYGSKEVGQGNMESTVRVYYGEDE